ncbi:MAG: hypothetical protein ACYCZF_13775 [Anaerolineae bacterium]
MADETAGYLVTTTLQIPPGPALNILKQLAPGTIIINHDTVNTVWLSESANVAPGGGYKLGPLGNITWSKNSDVWACVDTGVTAPVTINLGNTIAGVVNPVDVAAATASLLLAQGVPNVLILDTLYNGNLIDKALDVSKYSGLLITMYSPGVSTCILEFEDALGIATNQFPLRARNGGNTDRITFEIPVSGITASVIVGTAPANSTINIRGTNRLIDKFSIKAPLSTMPAVLNYTGAATVNVPVDLAGAGALSFLSSYTGKVRGYLSTTGNVAAAGNLIMVTADLGGTLNPFNLTNTAGWESVLSGSYYNVMFEFTHPVTPVSWRFTPDQTMTSLTVNLWLFGN